MLHSVFGVDCGTSNIKIYNSSTKEILDEKNIIAIKNKRELFAFGDEAYDMYEKAPKNIALSYPVKFGVIADIKNMVALTISFLNRSAGKKGNVNNSDFYMAVPYDITEVEKRAFYDLIKSTKLKSKKICVVDKPVADAIGVGVDVNKARGILVANIGADTTEISVLSLGGIVLSKLIKFGGNRFEDIIINDVKKQYNLIIGIKTAENIKKELGSATTGLNKTITVVGRHVVTGLPAECTVSSDLVYESMIESIRTIIDSIKIILERTPPELASDIIDTGVFITGGSSNIRNLGELITRETDLKVNICENPSQSVARGLKEIIENPEYRDLAYSPKDKSYC